MAIRKERAVAVAARATGLAALDRGRDLAARAAPAADQRIQHTQRLDRLGLAHRRHRVQARSPVAVLAAAGRPPPEQVHGRRQRGEEHDRHQADHSINRM